MIEKRGNGAKIIGRGAHSHVQPGQEGALVGKEGLGLYAHGGGASQGARLPLLGGAGVEPPVQGAALLLVGLVPPKTCGAEGPAFTPCLIEGLFFLNSSQGQPVDPANMPSILGTFAVLQVQTT